MLTYLLQTIITQTFESEVDKFQNKKDTQRALLVSFSLPTTVEEEGYRTLDLLLYGPMNYVGVWVRERFEGYAAGSDQLCNKVEPWKCLGYHDSCWRQCLGTLLSARSRDLNTFRTGEKWFSVIEVPEEIKASPSGT